jgi:dTDP-4-amino-4,6-dideoxygalactose transaminase
MKPIYVTQPDLPPLEDLVPLLEQIWAGRQLTNGGPFHTQLETALCRHLRVEQVSLFTNATIALITALQALDIQGEVITTPFSFAATSHALLWNRIEPVFVDIDPVTLNLDPGCLEAAITPRTQAILPVHCYGTPCDVESVDRIAKRHGLKVIYDAAHAFGVLDHLGQSILRHGDLSVLSFHATKVFNTFEGGAIVCADAHTKSKIDHLKNFGFEDEVTVVAPGINGKMSEFNAALGLLQLQRTSYVADRRAAVDARYRSQLSEVPGLQCLEQPGTMRHNHSYFPIRVAPPFALSRDELYNRLKAEGVYARRYFYPLISDMPMYRHLASAQPERLPVAQTAASEILCLPIFPALDEAEQARIIELVLSAR